MSWKNIVNKNNLNVSIINFSQIEKERIDAEYYKSQYLDKEKAIQKKSWKHLSEISSENKRYKQPVYVENSDIFVINSQYLRENSINYELARFGDSSSKLVPKNSIMINSTGVGTLGRVNINYLKDVNITVDSHVNIITAKGINPYFLTSFLQSSYGKSQIERNISGSSGQIEIYPKDFAQFKIPLPSINFQDKIEQIYSNSIAFNIQSKNIYKKAEEVLLKEIKLENYISSGSSNISERMLSKCLFDNRFDAEYWQPKYDHIEKCVSKIKQQKLGEIVSYKKGLEVGSEAYVEEGVDFIRVSDFSIYGIESGDKKITTKMYNELKDIYNPKKNEILFTKDGSIGISYAVNDDIVGIVSGAFLRLKSKIEIDNNYLTLVLNSIYCKSQIERMSGGAIISHLKPNDAMTMKIPILSQPTQTKLGNMVLDALQLRADAKKLFEKSKKAIEVFIEKDEIEAMKIISG